MLSLFLTSHVPSTAGAALDTAGTRAVLPVGCLACAAAFGLLWLPHGALTTPVAVAFGVALGVGTGQPCLALIFTLPLNLILAFNLNRNLSLSLSLALTLRHVRGCVSNNTRQVLRPPPPRLHTGSTDFEGEDEGKGEGDNWGEDKAEDEGEEMASGAYSEIKLYRCLHFGSIQICE